jgi:hypothetical protein
MAARLAASAVALLSAALTVGASPAYAADGPTVEFSGGSMLNLLVCKSQPSTAKLTVPAESRVTFVNRLGQKATLRVDGKAASDTAIGANQAVPVVFHYGPVNVSMTFDCGVGVVEEFKTVSVAVQQPAGVTTGPPRRSGGNSAGSGIGVTHPAQSTAAAAHATPGATTATPGRATATDQGATGPTTESTESSDPSLLIPGFDPSSAAGAAAANGPDDRVMVEAAVPASGTPTNGPAGLLALIATVCVVGVGMAAIRAIIAQRSTRASYA